MTSTSTSMVLVAVTVAAVGLTGIRCSGIGLPARTPPSPPPRRRRIGGRTRPRRTPPPDNVAVAAWCEAAARAVRAGATLGVALKESTARHEALAPVIGPILTAIARGRSLADAVPAAGPSALDPSTATGLALTVVRSCADLGGPAAAPLERVAATLRTRAAIADEQRAHSAQAQLSARVLTLVPIALLALLTLAEADVRGALATPAGLSAVGLGAILNVAGWRWMQRIIRSAR